MKHSSTFQKQSRINRRRHKQAMVKPMEESKKTYRILQQEARCYKIKRKVERKRKQSAASEECDIRSSYEVLEAY
jgi:hypothetical protein